jgi:hypothetical protein
MSCLKKLDPMAMKWQRVILKLEMEHPVLTYCSGIWKAEADTRQHHSWSQEAYIRQQ